MPKQKSKKREDAEDLKKHENVEDHRHLETVEPDTQAENAGSDKISKKVFESELEKLQIELVKMQSWVQKKGLKIVVVFEGRDAAGKGGTIKCITDRVSPRVFRTVALPAPTEREKTEFYFQRYLIHMPSAGEVVLFDRSWYNRAGVEHVMKFCTEEQYQDFLRLCAPVEHTLIDSGIILVKYWLDVSQQEQKRRFLSRISDGRKVWKLSPMDLEAHRRWYDYSRARDAMLAATDTEESPWYIVQADNKRRARLNCISHLLSLIPYEDVPSAPIKLPKRQPARGYVEPDWSYHFIPEYDGDGET